MWGQLSTFSVILSTFRVSVKWRWTLESSANGGGGGVATGSFESVSAVTGKNLSPFLPSGGFRCVQKTFAARSFHSTTATFS
jgi:hypothetical protein